MRRNRTVRTALVGVVLVAGLVTGLAGCRIPGTSQAADKPAASAPAQVELTPQQLVSDATRKSQKASTANFTMSMKLATGGTGTINIYAVGQMNDAEKAMSMKMKVSLPGLSNTVLRQRLVNGDYYMAGLPETGRRWVKLDPATAKQFQQGASSNPADQLAVFEKLSDGVTKVGPATVKGVQTTKYTGTLNLSTPATADESAELKQARKDFADAGLTSIPFTYYIDGQGLLARMSMSMDMKDGATKGTMLMSMNFSDWGAPVSIKAPPNAISAAEANAKAA